MPPDRSARKSREGRFPMRGRKSLMAGLVCGLACVGAILLYAQELHASVEAERAEVLARYGGEQVEVYVATRDIAVGETVSTSNAEKRLWVGELLPQDAVFDLAEVEDKILSSPVYEGEVVSLRRFGEGDTLVLQIPEGLCAVSVPSKSVSAVGGSVRAGSMVDVYATSGIATELLASSVLVLSTSATTAEGEQDSTDVTWVTLAVEPGLVEELIAAAQKTELYFVLPSDSLNTSQEATEATETTEGNFSSSDSDSGEALDSESGAEGASASVAGDGSDTKDDAVSADDAPGSEGGASDEGQDEDDELHESSDSGK